MFPINNSALSHSKRKSKLVTGLSKISTNKQTNNARETRESLFIIEKRDFSPKNKKFSASFYYKVIFLFSRSPAQKNSSPHTIFSSTVSNANLHVLFLPSIWHIDAFISKQCWKHKTAEKRLEVHNNDVFGDGDPEKQQRRIARWWRSKETIIHRPRVDSMAKKFPHAAADSAVGKKAW